ncbi:unnamed protein product [Rotaria socialis]|uniref:Uncharacterized protein n=1 Tax=Rotaria socialis TaxID=392032 RepID=A0A818V7W2_9BILA|nr:unnamed protein product [Rotaria socialis]CAF4934637.1 unnamed protein product [Rotaria socialis]
MFKSFGASSGEHFRFPQNLLSDGLHPNTKLVKLMWFGLHQAINRVNTHHATLLSIREEDQDASSSTSSKKTIEAPRSAPKARDPREKGARKKSVSHNMPFYKKPARFASSVHSRLTDNRKNNILSDEYNHEAGNFYSNLTWNASDAKKSQAASSKGASSSSSQAATTSEPWSWDFHHRVVRETRSKCYTQGIREQAIAEARLSTMIREHGLRAAEQGMIGSFNQAKLQWSTNAMDKINAPLKKIRLVQKDLTNLISNDEEEKEVEEDEDDNESTDDDFDDEN